MTFLNKKLFCLKNCIFGKVYEILRLPRWKFLFHGKNVKKIRGLFCGKKIWRHLEISCFRWLWKICLVARGGLGRSNTKICAEKNQVAPYSRPFCSYSAPDHIYAASKFNLCSLLLPHLCRIMNTWNQLS